MSAGRNPTPAPASKAAPFNEKAYADDVQAANALAVIEMGAQTNARAVAEQLGYEGRLTVDALEERIRLGQRRTVEALMDVGVGLLVLRELTPHGEFTERVLALGFSERTARRMMSAALKFGKTANLAVLAAAGTQSKLLELVVLDDGEIDALEHGDTVRGLTLDKVEKMTVTELKAALRAKDDDLTAERERVRVKGERINRLETELRRVQKLPPDEQLALKLKEATTFTHEATAVIQGSLRQALLRIYQDHDEQVDHCRPMLAGFVGSLQQQINALREEFALPEAAVDDELERQYKALDAQDAAAAASKAHGANGAHR